MTWRDNLRKARFRDAQFYVDTEDHTGGRRAVEHVHPGTDGVTTEDLGGQQRRISVTGYVLGAGFEAAEDALWRALTKPGPGTLVLPLGPERLVQVARDGVRVSKSTREGGVATFTMSFIEVDPADARPVARADTSAAVQLAADDAARAETETFTIDWNDAPDQPGWVRGGLNVRTASTLTDIGVATLAAVNGGGPAAASWSPGRRPRPATPSCGRTAPGASARGTC